MQRRRSARSNGPGKANGESPSEQRLQSVHRQTPFWLCGRGTTAASAYPAFPLQRFSRPVRRPHCLPYPVTGTMLRLTPDLCPGDGPAPDHRQMRQRSDGSKALCRRRMTVDGIALCVWGSRIKQAKGEDAKRPLLFSLCDLGTSGFAGGDAFQRALAQNIARSEPPASPREGGTEEGSPSRVTEPLRQRKESFPVSLESRRL